MKEICQVVDAGMCIGCGACGFIDNRIEMILREDGMPGPKMESGLENAQINTGLVCPFADSSLDETAIGRLIYSTGMPTANYVGKYIALYAGNVNAEDYRLLGSSGGFGTWIQAELLRNDLVDAVVAVSKVDGGFKYSYMKTIDEIKTSSKSKYYPVSLNNVLREIENNNERVAIVAVPCFVKSIRNIQVQFNRLTNIKYIIGLICGHMKSVYYAKALGWQMGVHPDDLQGIDFRIKDLNDTADSYSTKVTDHTGEYVKKTSDLVGTNWGEGAFKPLACDFCDDSFNELADLVVGDAWLPDYNRRGEGANVLIVRNVFLNDLLLKHKMKRSIKIDDLSVKDLKNSQSAGLRHKIDFMKFRIDFFKSQGRPIPLKRLKGTSKLLHTSTEKKIQIKRLELRELSFDLFREAILKNDIDIFTEGFRQEASELRQLIPSKIESVIRRIRLWIKKI